MKPRILFAYRYGNVGGPVTVLMNRFQTFSREFDLHVMFINDFGAVAAFPPGVARAVPSFADQVRLMRELAPDYVVVLDSGFLTAWDEAGSLGRLVIEVHTTTANLEFVTKLSPAQRIDLVVTVSDSLKRTLVERGVETIAPVRVVHNCLTEEWFGPPPATAPRADPLLLWIGRFEEHKRWWRFAEICEGIGAGFTPLVVGSTVDSREDTATFAARLFDESRAYRALWLPHVRHDLMPRVFAATAASRGALVLTTRNEGFPMNVAEATMMGCPVIAPAVGPLPEMLPADALYEDDDWAAAHKLVARVLEDPSFGPALASRAREIVEPLVRPERALADYEQALSDAL